VKIVSIEPTPSPNTMKINLDEALHMGKSNNYKIGSLEGAPAEIIKILSIEGVKGVYHVADFLAVERNAKYDWQGILHEVRKAFGGKEDGQADAAESKRNESFGEIKALVQVYKGIPMQVKLTDGTEEKRFGLPDLFVKSVREVQSPDDNIVMSRKWKELGVRYGEFEQVGNEVIEELLAAFPPERLAELVSLAKSTSRGDRPKATTPKVRLKAEDLDHPDWRVRYQLLEQMENPANEDLPMLEKALNDEKASIRRLATVYLGMIQSKEVLHLLYKALKDKSVTVRRTAGDCLSDLGYPEASEEMISALRDASKLVRWRAAMFLFEVGDERALAALKDAEDDPEFEVSMQVKLAIARIEHGEEAKGSVWKQMTEARKQ
jgi:hypothetical protein